MDENNNSTQKIKLGVLALLLLLLIGACGILNGFRSFKNDNSLMVLDGQVNDPSDLYYSSDEQYDSFVGADEGEGEITYELIRALDGNGIYVSYFSLLNDKSTQIVVSPNTPAGTYELLIRATASGDDLHKAGSKEFTVRITINKVDGSFDELPSAIQGLAYTGSSMNLANPGSSSTGTIYYKVDDGEWDTSIPQAKDAGTYTVYYKLVGDKNHNDIEEQSFTVTIANASVGDKPSSKTVMYNGQKQSIDYKDPAHVAKEGDASGTTPGVYKAIYTPENNYCWSDGSKDSVTVTLTITSVTVDKPSQLDVRKPYTGSEQTNGYSRSEYVDMTGTDRGTAVGVYKAVYTPKSGCIWSDGTSDPVIVTLTIESSPVDKPTNTDVRKVYNGQSQSNGYKKPECISMVGVDSGIDADVYKAIYTPKENYCWSDGSKDPVTVTLTIQPAPVKKPSVLKVEKSYNGKTQSNGYGKPSGVIVDGEYSGKDAGTYEAVYLPDSNHIWSDGSNDPVKVTLTITKLKVRIPTIDGRSSFRYDGRNHSVSLKHYNRQMVKLSGDTDSKADAGNYEITVELKDANNSVWTDGTTEAKTLNWSITPAKLNTPRVKTVFEYDPEDPVAHTVSEKDFDRNFIRNLMSIVESDEGTLPGEYSVTVKLNDTNNYTWSDGTTENKDIAWKINKARNPITLPDQKVISVNYNVNPQTRQFKAPENAVGAVTYEFKSARTKVTHIGVDCFDIVDENTNAIIIKPETPVGIYEVTITVHAAGDEVYDEFTGDIKITVVVTGLHYVIKFDGNGSDRGLVVDQDIYGTSSGERLYYNQYVRDAYEFTGWNTEKDGSGEGNFEDEQYVTYLDLSPYEHDGVITLYAQWAPKTIKVFYNLNGGSFAKEDEDKVVREYTVDSEPFTLCHPVKPHYSFDGWSGTGLSKVTRDVTVDPSKAKSNRVFNANWSGAKMNILLIKVPADLSNIMGYEISYIDEDDERRPTYGEKYGNIFPAIGKDGYYGGWYTLLDKEVTADSTVSSYLDNQTFGIVKSLIEQFIPEDYQTIYQYLIGPMLDSIDMDNTIILIGREKPYTNISYTVSHNVQNLDLNGYTELKSETRFGSTDADINGKDIALTVTGFTYASQEGDDKIKADGSSSVKLYYNRDINDVVFDSRGGSDVKTQHVPYDGLVEEPEDPVYSVVNPDDPDNPMNKKFSGWYYNGKLFDFNTRIRGKITLYARWDVKGSVNVIAKPFDPETGGVSGTGTYELGDEVVLTPYANEDYYFVEWNDGNTDNPRRFTVSEEDVAAGTLKYVAIFDKISSRSLVNYDQITYTAKPGEIINVTDLFKSILLIDRYSFEGSEMLDFDIDKSVLVSRNKAYVSVSEDAKDGTYAIDVTVRPYLIDLRHRRSTVRIYVQVDTDKHIVSFDSKGGSLVNSQYVPDGEKAAVPEKPYRQGYSFKGWYLDKELFDFDREITEDITLYASWSFEGARTIDVISNNDEYGSVSGGGNYADGEKVLIKATPNAGYKFVCWNNDPQLTSRTMTIEVDGDAEYIAYFEPLEDTYFKYNEMTYISNADTNIDVSDVFYDYDSDVKLGTVSISPASNNPLSFRDNRGTPRLYISRNAKAGEVYSIKVYRLDDESSYIIFNVEIKCKIEFDYSPLINRISDWRGKLVVGAAIAAFNKPQFVEYNSVPEKPDKAIIDYVIGLVSEYLHIGDTDQITYYLNGQVYDFSEPLISDIKLKVDFRTKYEVVFMVKDEVYKTSSVLLGDCAVRPENPEVAGDIFLYWEHDGEEYNFADPVTSDVVEDNKLVLTAKFVDGIPVTFNYNNDFIDDGEDKPYIRVINVKAGDLIDKPKDAVSAGYRHLGWYWINPETQLEEAYDFTKPVDEGVTGITIYAKWEPKLYQVVYDTNGGTTVSTRNNVKWNDNGLTPGNNPYPILPIYAFTGWYINEDCTVPYRNQTYAELANYNDETGYVVLYAGWYNRSIIHHTDKFSSVAGEEAEYIIRAEDEHYLLFSEYEILEASESGMFRMNKDNSGVIISSAAEPGTYYIKVSSVINTPIDYIVDIDILDHIQTVMIEWTVEPAPEIEELDDTDEDPDGVMFGMSAAPADDDADTDILNPLNENLEEEGDQPQPEAGASVDAVNNENKVDGEGGEVENNNSQPAGDVNLEMIPPVTQEIVVEEEPSDKKEDDDTSSGEKENESGGDAGGDGGPEAGEEGAPAVSEDGGSSGSDIGE